MLSAADYFVIVAVVIVVVFVIVVVVCRNRSHAFALAFLGAKLSLYFVCKFGPTK